MRKKEEFSLMKGLFLLIVFVTIAITPIGAVTNDGVKEDEISHAVKVLKGLETDKTMEWAIAILKEAAENESSAYAMNAIGLAYVVGAGVDKDGQLAIEWLERAGDSGYPDAFHNLGMIYKYAKCGIQQNFKKAYEAYLLGAEQGSVSCKYDAGFMLYKGLGCEQNYASAVKMFEGGVEKEHSPSMYMLGLCYRNGYGVVQDSVQATSLLNMAATLSYKAAIEELMRPYPENYLHDDIITENKHGEIPSNMPKIEGDMKKMDLFEGTYQGFLVMYDWSGKHVLAEKPIFMTVENKDVNSIYGTFILANDTIPYEAKMDDDGTLNFTSGRILMNERYTVGKKVNYKIEHAILNAWNGKLSGSLSLYSLKEKEPERPMYIELSRLANIGEGNSDKYSNISVSPIPFEYSFNASFELAESADAQIRMFDKNGIIVHTQNLGYIDAGHHTINITPNIKAGYYVLNIKVGSKVLRTTIVKN